MLTYGHMGHVFRIQALRVRVTTSFRRRFIGQLASRRVDAGLTEALFPLELDGGRNSLAAPKPSTSRFTNGCSRSA